MRSSFFLIAALFPATVFAFPISPTQAGDYKIGSIDVANPWSRATPKGTSVAAGYMKISNHGPTTDRLIGGSSEIASSFEVHEMTMDNGVAKMRPVTGGLEIKPGETVELKPGSFHVMFVGLKKPLGAGEQFSGTLVFEQAGTVKVEYDVGALGAGSQMPGMMPGH